MAEVYGKKRRAILKLGALATLLAGGAALAAFTPLGQVLSREGIGDAIGWLRSSTWAPVSYVAVYAGATALAIPGSILTLAGGAAFGLSLGNDLYHDRRQHWREPGVRRRPLPGSRRSRARGR